MLPAHLLTNASELLPQANQVGGVLQQYDYHLQGARGVGQMPAEHNPAAVAERVLGALHQALLLAQICQPPTP